MTRATTIISAIAASLLLAACFLIPGKFASTLDVKRDGAFTFAYKGEIVLITAASLGPPTPPDTVLPTCFGPVPGAPPAPPPPSGQSPNAAMRTFRAGQRPCTPDEIAKRTADAAATRQREGEQMAKIIGMDRLCCKTDGGDSRRESNGIDGRDGQTFRTCVSHDELA